VDNTQWVAYTLGNSTPPPSPPPPPSAADELRCAVRHLAIEAAAARIGSVFGTARVAGLVGDAVRAQECPPASAGHAKSSAERSSPGTRERGSRGSRSSATAYATAAAAAAAAARRTRGGMVVHISPSGSDASGDGSESSPFFSPHRALRAIRASRGLPPPPSPTPWLPPPATVFLEGGVYHLGALGPVVITKDDSNTAFEAVDPEGEVQPVLSGAVPLTPTEWKVHNGSVLAAALPPSFPPFATLFDESTHAGRRLIRARHPNGDPELPSGALPAVPRRVLANGGGMG
jgi:hypothetical protein